MEIFPGLRTTTKSVQTAKVDFWRRQFFGPRTDSQLTFDVIFGIIGPILCFIFDPIVFRSGFAGPSFFPEYQTVVYLFSGIEILLLCFWLIMGPGPEFSNALIGGALLTAGFLCVLIGCALLPYSLMGLMIGIGLFGFTPFLTAIVYSRNGWRSLCTATNQPSNLTRALGLVCGMLLVVSISVPVSLQIRSAITTSVNDIVKGDPANAPHAVQRLSVLRFLSDEELERIPLAYLSERDESRRQLLRSCYREITGEDLEDRVRILQD